jgi:predicted ester cyclase
MTAEEVVRALVARVWNEGRVEELGQYFATTFDHAGRPDDIAGLVAWHHDESQTWADLSYEIVTLVSDGRQVALRWRATGRHVGDWGPVGPTDLVVAWDGAHFFEVEGGFVTSMWAMADRFAKATQLGVVMTPTPVVRG